MKYFILMACVLFSVCQAAPSKKIPSDLYGAFTMNKQIRVTYSYRDDSYVSDEPLEYTTEEIDAYIEKAKRHEVLYYGDTDLYLYDALNGFIDKIYGKNVAVMGSVTPWYESILLAYGARPTTIEYNKIISDDPRLELLTVEKFQENPKKFDAILSISSFEHDGLGRYGDPINPFGDFEAMERTKSMLKKGGLLFLAVPVGEDHLYWNLHRIYGTIRLGLLLKGWEIVASFGYSYSDLKRPHSDHHQPIFVLRTLLR